tara:strand:- start:2536 stop:3615 length:1080 start_codon:yes stop_codon:yes gene_type:complete
MKITKKQLSKIVNGYLNEAPEDQGLGDVSDLPSGKDEDSKDILPDIAHVMDPRLSSHGVSKAIKSLWADAKKNPGDYHFPVYAFARYLGGESSDLTTEELSKVKNGQKYIAALTNMLDIAALPFNGSFKSGHKKNGFAMNHKGKDISFYVVDYEVLLGRGGKGRINSAWYDALLDEGKLTDHLGVTIGQAGSGGKQVIQQGFNSAGILRRPDFNNGNHRLVNEFDFTRLAPSEAKNMTFGDVFSFYLKDVKNHINKGISATLTYLAGRSLNVLVDTVANATPYSYDLILKSNVTEWPDMAEYPVAKSARPFLGNEIELIPGQKLDANKEKNSYDKALKNPDYTLPGPGGREASIRNIPS